MALPYQEFPSDLRRLTPRTSALSADSGPGTSIQGINTLDLPDGAICFAQDEGEDYRFRKEATTTANGVTVIAPSAGPGRWFLIHGSSCLVQTGSDEAPIGEGAILGFNIVDEPGYLFPRVQGNAANPLQVPLPGFTAGNILDADVTFSFEFADADAAAELRAMQITLQFVIDRGNGFELIDGPATSVTMDNQMQAEGGSGAPRVEISASVRAALTTVTDDVTVYVLVTSSTKGGTFEEDGDQSYGSISGTAVMVLRASELDTRCVSQVPVFTFTVITPEAPPFYVLPPP